MKRGVQPPTPKLPIAVLRFHADGSGSGLYTEAIDLHKIGSLHVDRASRVEFNGHSQKWEVSDLNGIRLFTHPSRQRCLDWERVYFQSASHSPGSGVPGRGCQICKPLTP